VITILEALINYEGAEVPGRTEPVNRKIALTDGLIQKLIAEEITATSNGSLDYAEPVNDLHHSNMTSQQREYSGGFGY